MKRSALSRLAVGSAVAAMAFGAVACEDMEAEGDLDPGMQEEGTEEDLGDDL